MIRVDNERMLREALVSCNTEIEITRSFSVSQPVIITGPARIRGTASAAGTLQDDLPPEIILCRASSFFGVMVSIEGGEAVFENLVIDGTCQENGNSHKDTEPLFHLSAGSLALGSSVTLKNSTIVSHKEKPLLSGQPDTSRILRLSDNIHIRSFHFPDRKVTDCDSLPVKSLREIPLPVSSHSSVKLLSEPDLFLLPENISSDPQPKSSSAPVVAAATFTKGFRITFAAGCDHTFPAVRLLPRTILTDRSGSAQIPFQLPVKRGYCFAGWQKDGMTADIKIYQPGEKITGITQDLILTAIWKPVQ